jgi:hypothetical protein
MQRHLQSLFVINFNNNRFALFGKVRTLRSDEKRV